MSDQLFPEVVDAGTCFSDAATIKKVDQFACISEGAEFGLVNVSENLRFSYAPAVKGFAGDVAGSLGADESGTILWGGYGYCGFLAVNTVTKDTLNMVPYIDDFHYEEVADVYKTDFGESTLLLRLLGDKKCFMLYDFKIKQKLYVSDSISADLFRCANASSLIQERIESPKVKWYLADLTRNGLVNNRTNKLTDLLTDKQLHVINIKSYNSEKRILAGYIDLKNDRTWFAVTWNDAFDDVSMQPLKLQCPSGYSIGESWFFSSDGKWIVNTLEKKLPIEPYLEKPLLVFYNVDDKYPGKISPPVFAGKTMSGSTDINGCFVNQSKLGPLFIELTGGSVVLVYKLNDALPIIATEMAKLAPK